MYGPATSLALLSRLDEKLCVGLLGFIGTFYTAIGGIRGVIWNDLFQALVMFTSLFTIVFKGVYDAGGLAALWEANRAGGRLNLLNFDPDPFIRQSVWSLVIGQFIYTTICFSFDQQMIQRFQASKSKQIARRALVLNSPGIFLIVSLCCLVGLGLYANFAHCDPLSHPDAARRIWNPNQLVGYFVVGHLGGVPGAAGLFLASIFCGSLSSVSSYVNSQAAIIWHDLLRPRAPFAAFDDALSLRTNKLLVVACGLAATALAFAVSTVGGNLVQISTSLNGAFNSPIMGLFLLGMLFSVTTPRGVIAGTVAGFAAALWLSAATYVTSPIYPMLAVAVDGCEPGREFTPAPNRTGVLASELTGFSRLYSLSYMWFMPFGTAVTVLVGLAASLLDGGMRSPLAAKKRLIYFDCLPFLSRGQESCKF
jgi:SSS family transporter